MSASPITRHVSEVKAIPRRILINNVSDINGSYSSTPGGTLFSTTPGGTKIVYEKSVLMNLRNSPISMTPPKWDIPNSIQKQSTNCATANPRKNEKKQNRHANNIKHGNHNEDTEQFALEI